MENKNIILWDRIINGVIALSVITHIIARLVMGKPYYDSPLRNWTLGILYGAFVLKILTTLVLGRKKDRQFWILTILVGTATLLLIAEAVGLIS